MAGVKGRSGGHNRKSIAEHVIRGTFRRDRHGAIPLAPAKSVATLMRALEARAEDVDILGMKLIRQGAALRPVRTKRNGLQMHPSFQAGLKLADLANELWDTWERLSRLPVHSTGKPAPVDSLDAFRRKKSKWNGLI